MLHVPKKVVAHIAQGSKHSTGEGYPMNMVDGVTDQRENPIEDTGGCQRPKTGKPRDPGREINHAEIRDCPIGISNYDAINHHSSNNHWQEHCKHRSETGKRNTEEANPPVRLDPREDPAKELRIECLTVDVRLKD